MAERRHSDMASSCSQMVERGRLLDSNKPGGAAVEAKPSSKNRPTCWRCGKQGYVQRNCKGRNSSGAVAVIAPNEGPLMRVLGQEDVEGKVHREEETTQTNSQIKVGL